MAEEPDLAPAVEVDSGPNAEQAAARGALHLVPLRIVPPRDRAPRRGAMLATFGGVVLTASLVTGFALLLDFRDPPISPEQSIAVEVVPSVPKTEDPPPPPAPSPPAPAEPHVPVASAGEPPPPFVPPPPEAAPAEVGIKPAEATPTPPSPEAQTPPAAPPPQPAPPVLSAPDGGFTIPVPAEPAASDEASAASASRSRAAAALARALPMDLSMVPSTFSAILSGEGTQTSQAYRGLVYGRIQRAHRAMEEARARHLKGQVMVSFQVDAGGHAADLRVTASSGSSTLDALALAMVREAEPFPPPPSGTDTVFSPAFAVGEE